MENYFLLLENRFNFGTGYRIEHSEHILFCGAFVGRPLFILAMLIPATRFRYYSYSYVVITLLDCDA